MNNSPTLLPITRHNLLAEALDAGMPDKAAHAISYNLYDAEFALERWTICFNECHNLHDYLVASYRKRYGTSLSFALLAHESWQELQALQSGELQEQQP